MGSGVFCSPHQAELYEDVHGGQPMGRFLCPQPGCNSVVTADQLSAMRDQAWCAANGMTAPGWGSLPGRD